MRTAACTRLCFAVAGCLLLWAAPAVAQDSSLLATSSWRPAPARVRLLTARAARPALARGLSPTERVALLAGETIARPMRFEQGRGSYVGGVAYQLVRASPPEVLAALRSVPELVHLLPCTKQARLIDAQGARARVELVQGKSLIEATYTVHLQHHPADGALRFWLDPSRPHDIDDVWGYFRAQPFGARRSLVTVAVALDVGDGLVRLLFEDRIQHVILSAPRQIRDFVEPRSALASR